MPKVLEKSRAIPLLTLRACVDYKKGESQPNGRMPVKIHETELRLFLVRASYFYCARESFVLFSIWTEPCAKLTLGLYIKWTP